MNSATELGLSEEQVETYFREGFLVVENLVSEGEIDKVLAEAAKIPVVAGGGWTPQIFDHENPDSDPILHRLLVDPALVAAVESILESPARVYYGMLAVVPARGGKGLDWHQDNMYDVVLGRALNVFVALCDITPDKGILWVAPRTHLAGVKESLTAEGHRVAETPENGMPLATMKKGSAVIFDRNTLHRSLRNDTDEHRYAYAAQYQEDKARNSSGVKDPLIVRADALRERWNRLG